MSELTPHQKPEMIKATTSSTTTISTTTTTTTESEEPEPSYPPMKCGGNGFYQVGKGCYTFTFYRSITFKESTQFCNV